MRARLTYRLLVSPRPRPYLGLLVGLVLAVVSVAGVILAGMAAQLVTHTAAAAIVAAVTL